MSPESRAFLERVRDAEAPDPDAERRVLAAVRASVAAGAAATAADSARPPVTGAVAPIKLGVLGVWLLAGGLIVLPPPALPPSEPHATRTPAAPESAPHAADRSSAPAADEAGALAVSPESPASRARGRAPASLGEERSSAPAVDEPGALAVSPQSPASRAQPRARGRAPASLREELELLARVQAALRRGDAATALRDLDQHRTLDEQLLGERAAARVLALCSLGRKAEGRRVRAELMQREPTSPHRSALERACVEAEPSD
jgi:hypothetical protein